ncbi:hypothetical protein [Pantoea ananatis]|uniref:hypothetical protein n=1 Tax=Pantoea ananas TaxID=553 RepID=UPI001EE5373D|nr:hypothetical protein [Pantoea ananatis]PKC45532.1 hypothetical protein V461_05830 [Pantoea ananatis BRT98]
MEYVPLALSPGAVLSDGKLISYAMKVRLERNNDQVFYLGYDRIVELARALTWKTELLQLNGKYSQEFSTPETLKTEEEYRKEQLRLTDVELSNPDVNYVVHRLDAYIREESVLLSISLHNKNTVNICIPDDAVEIFSGYMFNTLIEVGGEHLLNIIIKEISEKMINIPISVCVYSGPTQTTYDVKTEFKTTDVYKALKTAYIAGIRNNEKKIVAACIFISSIEDKTDPQLSDVAYAIFNSHTPTKVFVGDIYSIPLSRLKVNLDNGTIEEAFSETEIEMLYSDFYFKNSTEGNA